MIRPIVSVTGNPSDRYSWHAGRDSRRAPSGPRRDAARRCCSPKQRETRRQYAQADTIIGRKLDSAGGLQHVVHVVPANWNRLSEGTVKRLPGDSQPRARWAAKALIPGHQVEMMNSGLHGERGQEVTREHHVALSRDFNVSRQRCLAEAENQSRSAHS
jgi:hypothetical protein